MGFHCDLKTLERLEWPRLAEWLARETATQRAAEACRTDLFAASHEAVAERLAETSELRALLDAGEELPLQGVEDLRETQAALRRGALVPASGLAEVWTTLQAAARAARFLTHWRERTPRLADLADAFPDLRRLEKTLARCLTPEGELRDDATSELKRARRRVRDLESEIQRRMSVCLNASGIRPHLQDHYATVRQDRPVLPVRADARQYVRGIVHDVSSSGTTVFIEPENVVECSNQLRIAQTELEREIERLLRELGSAVDSEADEITRLGDGLETLDVTRAKARLSRRLVAEAPETGDGVPLALHQLRHPLLLLEAGLQPSDVVANDFALPERARGMVISGPNAGGKTVVAKAVGLAALSVRAGMHVVAAPGSSLPILDRVEADIGDEQDLRSGLSTFSARMSNLATILESACERTLVILDEVGDGTEPGEGAALAQSILEALVERGAVVIATTHFNRLKELAGNDERFVNASAEFDSKTLMPTYRLRVGVPGSSGAIWVAQRMGLDEDAVQRAQSLLDGGERSLEALTRGLSEMRQELEAERRNAARAREESEAARAEYERRARVLREAREKALAAMKAELEGAFQGAQREIARVMRQVQQGSARSGKEAGRAANLAREELSEIRARASEVRSEQGEERIEPPDLSRLQVGARLRIRGLAGSVELIGAPERGRITVRGSGARLNFPIEQVEEVLNAPEPKAVLERGRVNVDRVPAEAAGSPECDLRGLRVDEALDRADAHLQRMLATGVNQVSFIHGHGSGALREAVRAWLRQLTEVSEFRAAPQEQGGNGVTIATLDR